MESKAIKKSEGFTGNGIKAKEALSGNGRLVGLKPSI
jgi:hypothetical protein